MSAPQELLPPRIYDALATACMPCLNERVAGLSDRCSKYYCVALSAHFPEQCSIAELPFKRAPIRYQTQFSDWNDYCGLFVTRKH